MSKSIKRKSPHELAVPHIVNFLSMVSNKEIFTNYYSNIFIINKNTIENNKNENNNIIPYNMLPHSI